MQSFAPLYLVVFGLLTIVGGVIGFVKARSTPSLVAGGIAGALLIMAGYYGGLLVGTSPKPGLVLGLAVSAALAGRFVTAFRKSGKVMPAGMMAVLGILGVVVTTLALLR